MALGSSKEIAKSVVDESVNTVDNEEEEKDTLISNYRLRNIDPATTDALAEKPKTESTLNGLTDRKSDGNLADFDAKEDEVAPLEERLTKESVVTIDTTDRTHRRALRAQHTFAAKKTVAQGMMDVALITANANQLRYLVEYQRNSPTFFVNVFLIVVSLLLQIAVGVSLIFKGRFDIQGKGKSPQAQMINNYVVVGVFLITIINVFVAAFSVTATSVTSTVPQAPP